MEHDMVREFRKELANIRDRINFLFDKLESAETEADKYKTRKQLTTKTGPVTPPETGNSLCSTIVVGIYKVTYDIFIVI
jgi:hypothetical protein